MDEIKVSSDYKNASISDELVKKTKYIVKRDSLLRMHYDDITTDMSYRIFDEIVTDFINECNTRLNLHNDIEFDKNMIEGYNELLPKKTIDKKYHNIISYYLRNEKEADLVKTIDSVYQINKKIEEYYLTRDLIKAKDDTIIDMKYFMSEEDISSFDKEYTNAILNNDTVTMKKLLEDVQGKILNEWANYFGNLDTMNDDNFCFLGHSSKTTEYKGEFKTKYVSCSLFNQDINDAFNNDFGFIMEPVNIVGANSCDMYVDNEAIDEDTLMEYSSIKKIHHPQRLIDECLKYKQENQDSDNIIPVYSEVVTLGFHPTAIFCFTNGAKNYDYNYERAYKLQKSFPSLKVYDFDVMKRKTGKELESFKLELVDTLLEKLTSLSGGCSSEELFRYDYFFTEFDKLKQKENYTEADIELIFRKNQDMISYLDSNSHLFSLEYSSDEIKYILGNSYKYNINSIFKEGVKPFVINELAKLLPYKEKLDEYYNGLGKTVFLLSKIEVTDSMLLEIKDTKIDNFEKLSNYLANKQMIILNDKEEKNVSDLQKNRKEREKLNKEKVERENSQREYSKYHKINMFKDFQKPLKCQYNKVLEEIDKNDIRLNNLLKEYDQLLEQLNSLTIKKEEELQKDFTDVETTSKIDEILKEVNLLSFHPLLNIIKINKRKKSIEKLTLKKEESKKEFLDKREDNIADINNDINATTKKVDKIKENMEDIKTENQNLKAEKETILGKVNYYFSCNKVEDIDEMIKKSDEFLSRYDSISNDYTIIEIDYKISELDKEFLGIVDENRMIKEEKNHLQM